MGLQLTCLVEGDGMVFAGETFKCTLIFKVLNVNSPDKQSGIKKTPTPELPDIEVVAKSSQLRIETANSKLKPNVPEIRPMSPIYIDPFSYLAGALFSTTPAPSIDSGKSNRTGFFKSTSNLDLQLGALLDLPVTFDGMYRTRSMSYTGFMSPQIDIISSTEVLPRFPKTIFNSNISQINENDSFKRADSLDSFASNIQSETTNMSDGINKLQVKSSLQNTILKRQSSIMTNEDPNEGTGSNSGNEVVDNLNSRPKIPSILTHSPLETENLALVFAQMVGQITVDSNYIKETALEPLLQKVIYNAPGMSNQTGFIKGGGSLGYSTPKDSATQRSFPIFNTPPTIILVNELVKPEEAIRCHLILNLDTYEIKLPSILPPSHRGKICRILYKLYIGVQRDASAKVTQVFSIPFRLFSRTEFDGSRCVYEVLNPVIYTRDVAEVQNITNGEVFNSPLFDLPSSTAITPMSPNNSQRASGSRKYSLVSAADFETVTFDNILHTIENSNKGLID